MSATPLHHPLSSAAKLVHEEKLPETGEVYLQVRRGGVVVVGRLCVSLWQLGWLCNKFTLPCACLVASLQAGPSHRGPLQRATQHLPSTHPHLPAQKNQNTATAFSCRSTHCCTPPWQASAASGCTRWHCR